MIGLELFEGETVIDFGREPETKLIPMRWDKYNAEGLPTRSLQVFCFLKGQVALSRTRRNKWVLPGGSVSSRDNRASLAQRLAFGMVAVRIPRPQLIGYIVMRESAPIKDAAATIARSVCAVYFANVESLSPAALDANVTACKFVDIASLPERHSEWHDGLKAALSHVPSQE